MIHTEIYFLIGLVLILINIIFVILTIKLHREDFYFDTEDEVNEFPYGFKLIGFFVSLIVFFFCFLVEYLFSNSLTFLIVPVVIAYPLFYYFMFICNGIESRQLHKKEFFLTMFALVSLFYLLSIPFSEDVSLSHQIELIITTNIPLLELIIIAYVHLLLYVIFLNIILYFDAFNYLIKTNSISSQLFRKQHSILTIVAFTISGYIASAILNGQFLIYPETFDFDKFQNIILIYQIFLSSVTIILALNKVKKTLN